MPDISIHEELQTVIETRNEASNRLSALKTKAMTGLLTEDEETEQLRLERRLDNLQPVLDRLNKATAQAQQTRDIDAVVTQWDDLVSRKLASYERLREAVLTLTYEFAGLRLIHEMQESVIGTLPMALQQKLLFIDNMTYAMRLCQGMGRGQAWTDLLLQPSPLPIPRVVDMAANDPGSRELSQRILAPFRHIEESNL